MPSSSSSSTTNLDSESSFDFYRNEFKGLIQQIEIKFHDNVVNNNDDDSVDDNSSSSKNKSKTSSTMTIQDLLQNCDELIQQMELEIRATTTTTTKNDDYYQSLKQDRKDILQACKLQLLSYKTLERTTQPPPKTSGSTDDNNNKQQNLLWDETIERNYLQQAMAIQDQVGRQNTHLENALQSILETEQVANSISEELTKNRTKISNAHQNTKSISTMTEHANGLLKSMSKPWYKFW